MKLRDKIKAVIPGTGCVTGTVDSIVNGSIVLRASQGVFPNVKMNQLVLICKNWIVNEKEKN